MFRLPPCVLWVVSWRLLQKIKAFFKRTYSIKTWTMFKEAILEILHEDQLLKLIKLCHPAWETSKVNIFPPYRKAGNDWKWCSTYERPDVALQGYTLKVVVVEEEDDIGLRVQKTTTTCCLVYKNNLHSHPKPWPSHRKKNTPNQKKKKQRMLYFAQTDTIWFWFCALSCHMHIHQACNIRMRKAHSFGFST